jgi:peptidoglycan/xylan/chitin deacetylase (PgdA/CDA1 family)
MEQGRFKYLNLILNAILKDMKYAYYTGFAIAIILILFIYPSRIHREQLSPIDILYLEHKDVEQNTTEQMQVKTKVKPAGVPILVYHSVSPYYPSESSIKKEYAIEPEMFEKQIQYLLDNGYQVVSLDDLSENLINNKPLPKKSFVLTFDDGWKSQYQYAFPILKKYNLTATFFIYTDPISNYHSFMNWDEIKDLDNSGMTIGDHTKTHPYISAKLDDKTLRTEIIGSKKTIEDHLGKQISFFAYPFYHYTPEAENIVKEAGFKAARGGYTSIKNNLQNILTLRGIQAPNNMEDFIKEIN